MFSAFQTFGRLGAGARAVAAAWSPSALWPTGTEPGMWISPRDLTSQWQDYTGTTPVATPGTVADSANPVGLALDIRAGAPEVLGPELVTNGDFSAGATGWTLETGWSVSGGQASITNAGNVYTIYQAGLTPGKTYFISFTILSVSGGGFTPYCGDNLKDTSETTVGIHTAIMVCGANGYLGIRAASSGVSGSITDISFKEVPGNHMLQSTSTSRPLLSARKNLLVGTDALSTQSVTVIASQCVLSFTGTGTVTLSGVSTAGPLVGTGASDRVSLTFTPTSGSLTLTVSGSVTLAQLEYVA